LVWEPDEPPLELPPQATSPAITASNTAKANRGTRGVARLQKRQISRHTVISAISGQRGSGAFGHLCRGTLISDVAVWGVVEIESITVVLALPGVRLDGKKLALAPAGSPLAENVTLSASVPFAALKERL
jgi:hypothetical protein